MEENFQEKGMDPMDVVREMVLRQAEQLSQELNELEEAIAHVSRRLDIMCKARDTLHSVLAGTEGIRVALRSDSDQELAQETRSRRRLWEV